MYAHPITSTSTSAGTTVYTDTDYSNDEAIGGQMADHTQFGLTEPDRDNKSGSKKQKGKKQRIKSKHRQLLKNLKKKLLKNIDSKQHKLSDEAFSLENKIGGLESEIEYSKQSMLHFEELLSNIKKEMSDIDQIKANLSKLVKGGLKLDAGGALPEELLMMDGKYTEDDMVKSINEYLNEGNKRSMYISSDAYDVDHQPFDRPSVNDLDNRPPQNKREDMNAAAEEIGSNAEHVSE